MQLQGNRLICQNDYKTVELISVPKTLGFLQHKLVTTF